MQSRIDRLFLNIPDDAAVFISGYPNVFYYSGFTSEDAYLLIARDKRFIITDSRYFTQAKQESPDFELVPLDKGFKYIFSLVNERIICFEQRKMSVALFGAISDNAENKEFNAFQNEIDMPRQIKDKHEIETIAIAEKIGDDAFSYVLDIMHTGMTEREIALELEMHMKKNGADDLSFTTIAASGVRSCMPHGAASGKVIEKGDFLTLDFGCVYKGYCSDMTRTVVFGTPSDEQVSVYNAVLKAQTAALDGLFLGIACADADKIARDVIKSEGYEGKFTHSLGHSVGVEIHESPNFSPKSDGVLQNGNVMSVEPGIYIDGWGGVRIEDLIAVSDNRIINLSNSPKGLIVL